ncbi:MAG: DeoR/GlpR transcriptional regulator [Mesorhizobium sp.]|jgi:DeoR/GlpR family transcriptional regulator of sugar metabolism|uniref:Transcriptional regulator, DeoR family n=1 Tax=Mesorhizobium muleiense TaxID=1004279 RepID=A0A1G8W0I6_9HYPH|nr:MULTISPECIES: DeoR/GlpR family DNA-binding transcription regulator [Mesorhizobium]MCF6098670.1 DeoR/GlpR family DNA-binding transcription regulator [Mesorhizobium muleiense]MCF6110565.1 DeoR/GlpR family DNA-binding transcription regulator [Mesorhizobium muleiense]RWO89123.1 MAG: DeoR/GlpR transcriptional regulator [Mesorhizobium sp.]RWP17918.1 MAG: DeoR/GlpR transcriptional regulator [Mesorhizobium sp.]RWP35121.1 MAG: DeoR/GlpR transcriptional regulator [Mesorhizobium sp.]
MIKADERREEIADYVIKFGQVRIDDLVEHFGVSRMTIHRHIDQLAHQGVLRKLHGAVTVQPSGLYESAFRYRVTVGRAEKDALAHAALDYIEAGQAVMLDDSTTANAIAPLLPDIKPLTVITNSVATAALLTNVDDIDFICLGGQYHRTYNAYIGIVCENAVAQLRANLLICSASAISGTTAFIQDQHVVRVKQAMVAASTRRILVVDHSKFDKVALHVFDDLTRFDAVLTTDGVSDAQAQKLEQAGVKLRIVKMTKP